MTNLLEQAINCDDGGGAAAESSWTCLASKPTSWQKLANGWQAARPHHRQLAPGGGGIPGLVQLEIEQVEHRFPPPLSVEEQDACFVVRDQNGQQFAYIYFEDEPGQAIRSQVAHTRRGAKFILYFIQLVLYAFGALENFALTIQTAVHGTSRAAHETAGATT
jgi:hypothetical protein